MKKTIQLFLVLFIQSVFFYGQNGSLDTAFNSGNQIGGSIHSLAIQPDGKIIIGGNFTSYRGTPISRIARINIDGSLDATFNPGLGASALVNSITYQPDGKIIIGGAFSYYNNIGRKYIARLNNDGSLDTTFNPGSGPINYVYSTAVQPDGKIFIGGIFTNYSGTIRPGIARLNSDGTLDTTFNPGFGGVTVYAISLLNDGKIIIGGDFSSFNSVSGYNRIARLNSDGSIDTTFNPGSGVGNTTGEAVKAVAVQSDGKIIIGGSFSSYNGTPIKGIARLHSNGALDTTFNPGTGINDWAVQSINIQGDGKILMGGTFVSYNGTTTGGLARTNSNGLLDSTFNTGIGPYSESFSGGVYASIIQPDGKIIIGGAFRSYNGTEVYYLARINNTVVLETGSFTIDSNFKIFPNPTQNEIIIELNELNNTKLQVIDINGRVLMNQSLNHKTNKVNTSNLPIGMYSFKISSDKGVEIAKIVKN